MEEKKDEVLFDFKSIKNIFKKKEKSENAEKGKAEQFISNNQKYLIPIALILIAIFFSSFFRMYPASLPMTEQWAASQLDQINKQVISQTINQQYPNLPDVNKNGLINAELAKLNQEGMTYNPTDQGVQKIPKDAAIEQVAKNYKQRLQYTAENGKDYTYLLAIDPYLWYGYGKNFIECGSTGCDLREDGKYYNYRNGRVGQTLDVNIFSKFGVWIYKFMNIFTNFPLMQAFFLLPVIMIGLAIIPAFFIAKKMGGNVGGFFAAMIIAVNSALLSRTPGGFSDTDPANVLFPLLIFWFFLEVIEAKDWRQTTIYSLLGGISFYIFSTIWKPHHIFDFLLVASIAYIGYGLFMNFFRTKNPDITHLKGPLSRISIFLFVSLAFIVYHRTLSFIPQLFSRIIEFVQMKDVGINSLWPNVLTTVAEFNEVPFIQIMNQMGGKFFFLIAVIGLFLPLLAKDKKDNKHIIYGALIGVWFIGSAYSFIRGIRFAILLVPPFAIAFGVCLGTLYRFFTEWLSKELNVNAIVSKVSIILLFMLLLLAPVKQAHSIALNEIPSYNDAWDSTLDQIKTDADDGIGYITTWWDFGHWFVSKDVRVTFDGGNQGERIHWVGKSLLTDNETEAIGILRMLNCGQQEAPHILEKYLKADTVKSIEVLNKILVKNKDEAKTILEEEGLNEEEINEVLEKTHCDDLLPHYLIASEDMVGKAGVWGHFGSWDFKKALMWQTANKLDEKEGVDFLKTFDMTEEEASDMYYQIHNTKADRWISPWPGFSSRPTGCTIEENTLKCVVSTNNQQIPLEINLLNMEAIIPGTNKNLVPNSLVYIVGNETIEKEMDGEKVGFSVLLIPNGNSPQVLFADPLLVNSMFTKMFYLQGHGLKHFKPFSEKRQINGQNIFTYKVDWDSSEYNNAFTPVKDEPQTEEAETEEIKEQVKASHILVKTESRTDEEALKRIKEIQEKINDTNFADIAKKYSEGPSNISGGNLGYFEKGMMVPEFEKEAFNLEIDDVSEPVKTTFGYHLIKVFDIITTTEEKKTDLSNQAFMTTTKETEEKKTDLSDRTFCIKKCIEEGNNIKLVDRTNNDETKCIDKCIESLENLK